MFPFLELLKTCPDMTLINLFYLMLLWPWEWTKCYPELHATHCCSVILFYHSEKKERIFILLQSIKLPLWLCIAIIEMLKFVSWQNPVYYFQNIWNSLCCLTYQVFSSYVRTPSNTRGKKEANCTIEKVTDLKWQVEFCYHLFSPQKGLMYLGLQQELIWDIGGSIWAITQWPQRDWHYAALGDLWWVWPSETVNVFLHSSFCEVKEKA